MRVCCDVRLEIKKLIFDWNLRGFEEWNIMVGFSEGVGMSDKAEFGSRFNTRNGKRERERLGTPVYGRFGRPDGW